MIEVELRGRLTVKQAAALKQFLKKSGKHTDSHTREMILLREYKGYSDDPTKRLIDIRLRNTDGKCEIVLKRKASRNNAGREETILKLKGSNLDAAKEIAKGFGCTRGLWMHRRKDVYMYRGVEWAIVEAPKKIFFYEAEKTVKNSQDVDGAKREIIREASALKLKVFTPKEYRAFVDLLGRRVNKDIAL